MSEYDAVDRFKRKEIEVSYEDKYETKAEKILISKANNEAKEFENNFFIFDDETLDDETQKLFDFIKLLQKICDKARKTYFSFNEHVVFPMNTSKTMEENLQRLRTQHTALKDIKEQEQKQGKKKSILSFFSTSIDRKIELLNRELEFIDSQISNYYRYNFKQDNLMLGFSEFNNFYTSLLNIKTFISNKIGNNLFYNNFLSITRG